MKNIKFEEPKENVKMKSMLKPVSSHKRYNDKYIQTHNQDKIKPDNRESVKFRS